MSTVEARVAALFDAAIADRVTPGGVVSVGTSAGATIAVARGHLTYARDAAPVTAHTVYDLASLTKVLATTPLALEAHHRGLLPLDTRISDRLATFAGGPHVVVQDLLEHAAGLAAHRPWYRAVAGRAAYLARIAAEPPAYAVRSVHLYTDLGFILLGALVEEATGVPLRASFARLCHEVAPGAEVAWGVEAAWQTRVAPSGVDWWRQRLLAGHVHDSNAAALGGAAGHAGLFGTAEGVGAFARWWLRLLAGDTSGGVAIPQALARRATSRGTVPGSSRGLGWDTMVPTSSCGHHLSAQAFGHTGFTGTSLWIDPARDLYVVVLTNRVHASDDVEGIRHLRVALHDAVAGDGR